MLKLCRVTKLKVIFPVLVYVFNFDLFEFSAAILEKGLFEVKFHLLSDARERAHKSVDGVLITQISSWMTSNLFYLSLLWENSPLHSHFFIIWKSFEKTNSSVFFDWQLETLSYCSTLYLADPLYTCTCATPTFSSYTNSSLAVHLGFLSALRFIFLFLGS